MNQAENSAIMQRTTLICEKELFMRIQIVMLFARSLIIGFGTLD
jgi:hypothetical protein